jgi:hypothetical protein
MLIRLLVVVLAVGLAVADVRADGPRVAVWEPGIGTREGRFAIDRDHLDRVTQWLTDGGVNATRVTSEQIDDPATFGADRFDAIILRGDAVPRRNFDAITRFVDNGGVLIALAARMPFIVAIEIDADGSQWTMSPKEPKFAWQTEAILGLFDFVYVYNPGRHDQGINHKPTPLLTRYVANAPSILKTKLPSLWIVPRKGGQGEAYPLLASTRTDGADVPSQIYVMQKGGRRAIVSLSGEWTGESTSKRWPVARETVVAMARLAHDLRSGDVKLTPDLKAGLTEDQPLPEPLRHRLAESDGVDPDGAKPIVRWGRFDGSSADLDGTSLPARLDPATEVQLGMPLQTAATTFRIRGAYGVDGAGLSVRAGKRVLWDEALVYIDASGRGNYAAPDLAGVPAEFHRNILVPPGEQTITVRNGGTGPVYFDAAQLESVDAAAPGYSIGLNAGYMNMFKEKDRVSRDLTRRWQNLRTNIRTQNVDAPGKEDRWRRIDASTEAALDINPHVHMLFEGTPAWAAITPERYEEGRRAGRPHVVAPDPEKYAEIVRHVVEKYKDRIDAYEIWNEGDSQQFYRGSYDEYVTLFKTITPVIKQLDPDAKIISTGMAGFKESFVQKLAESGCLKMTDWFAFHPYAGKSPAWDMPYGQIEGSLYAKGIQMPIFCNEQGFPWRSGEWFQPPPQFTPAMQAQLLDIAMARLLANGVTLVSVFHAGGDEHHFGLIDRSGTPRPAYHVFEDYLALGERSGKRIPVALRSGDGEPLRGVYVAAATHEDGSVTAVINPAEVERLRPPLAIGNRSNEFEERGDWTSFFGKVTHDATAGQLILTPEEGRSYMGGYTTLGLDLARWPILEVDVPSADRFFQLSVKVDDKDVMILKDQAAGTHRVDLRPLLKLDRPAETQLTVRAFGAMRLDAVRLLAAPDSLAADAPAPAFAPEPLRVRIAFPFVPGKAPEVHASTAGVPAAQGTARFPDAPQAGWAEVEVALTGRTTVRVLPGRDE